MRKLTKTETAWSQKWSWGSGSDMFRRSRWKRRQTLSGWNIWPVSISSHRQSFVGQTILGELMVPQMVTLCCICSQTNWSFAYFVLEYVFLLNEIASLDAGTFFVFV